MKRNKRHKVKREMPETSSSHSRGHEEHDLAYYIHDRVELMHQVFSVIKYKELKAMVPACVRNVSVDDLQELCTEELLGISSKRLCAILDGAEPPSDTESSSQSPTEHLEIISLDSISSDEELLSQDDKSKKKKHKHRRHRRGGEGGAGGGGEGGEGGGRCEAGRSRASRAGLTVLELLELQARARAIRAQLHQERRGSAGDAPLPARAPSSGDDVQIKEEPPDVVEISSDDEKPAPGTLRTPDELQQESSQDQPKSVTKRVNDLIITVPQAKTQKIKLNRNKSVPQATSCINNGDDKEQPDTEKNIMDNKDKSKDKTKSNSNKKDKNKKKKKKRLSHASDNDEITLQLSDTEKMDLLEDLDRKSFDNVTSDSSSDSDSDADLSKKPTQKQNDVNINREEKLSKSVRSKGGQQKSGVTPKIVIIENKIISTGKNMKNTKDIAGENENSDKANIIADLPRIPTADIEVSNDKSYIRNSEIDTVKCSDAADRNDVLIQKLSDSIDKDEQISTKDISHVTNQNIVEEFKAELNHDSELLPSSDLSNSGANEKYMSEGELSDRDSSEVEACELNPEVVCVSDEDVGKHRKKKKKKDKKSKKEKRVKKKDSSENDSQNKNTSTLKVLDSEVASSLNKNIALNKDVVSNSDSELTSDKMLKDEADKICITLEINQNAPDKSQDLTTEEYKNKDAKKRAPDTEQNQSDVGDDTSNLIVEISDEVYELSDDSSNEYEMETSNVLSKEPTASEIEALSAKIDEIEKAEQITDGETKDNELEQYNIEVSWKQRYLDSNKVKRVLNTSNILNALRKKNKQIKRSLEESKVKSQEETQDIEQVKDTEKRSGVLEGSIEQYNTLQASTEFVEPLKQIPINDTLKKDAKQLLKMYKKLLKYNDMNRKREPSKKKKKKKKSKKSKESAEEKT